MSGVYEFYIGVAMKYILLILCCLITFNVKAVGNINLVEIDGVFVRENRVDIYLKQNHSNPTGCSITTQLIILSDEFKNSDKMFSAVLAAASSNRKISGWVGGCYDDRAKLNAVYIDTVH